MVPVTDLLLTVGNGLVGITVEATLFDPWTLGPMEAFFSQKKSLFQKTSLVLMWRMPAGAFFSWKKSLF
jgi:hypothetical protein